MRGESVVILTGAGISAESGVRTFRDNDGLWENHRIEDVATPVAWRKDPDLVWKFYQARRNQMQEVEPNPAHIAIARFQKNHQNVTLITQNERVKRTIEDIVDNKARVKSLAMMRILARRSVVNLSAALGSLVFSS